MDVGVVAIKGLTSNYYLAISRKGELYGAVSVRVRGPIDAFRHIMVILSTKKKKKKDLIC